MGTFIHDDFDPATWDELLQLFGRDGVAEMLDALQGDLPRQRQQLDAALLAQDRLAVKRIAHTQRGVALQFGATALAECCGAIERAIATDVPLARIAVDTMQMLERQLGLTRRLNDALHGV